METSEGICAVDIHGTAAADTLTAGASKRESWVDVIFDLDEPVEYHRTTIVQRKVELLDVRWSRVPCPSVDLKPRSLGFELLLGC